ncbi:Alpha/beta hydrolase domain-containing protein 13 [Fasciola gigantica]|uniref:Alpha/beta hydrolase domain-containing protein 13 n=1 Tax=Fasciola gigantica TaxID=46835 RepID=A0A504Z1N3_FASGI|nr:Alpha/beta hydrolase domain-containing protein 13 [Fasciola gigantica]
MLAVYSTSFKGFMGVTAVGIPPPLAAVAPTVPPTAGIGTVSNAVTAATPTSTTQSETQPAQYVREKPPVTTVFVGNISERASDQLMKALLMVKVDPKTEDLLAEYRKKKEKTGEEGTLGATAEEVDSSTQRDDDGVKAALQAIVKENESLLDGSESPRNKENYSEGPRHLTMEDMDLDDERKDLINREIEIFRKRNEKEDQNESATRRVKPRDNERSSGLQLYSSYVDGDRRDYRRDKSRRSRSRSPDGKRSRGTITRSLVIPSGKSQVLDEEEEAIRKKLERKLREKEESYQKRLKQWESRERKKTAEYDHEREHERRRQKELQVEAQRLREFFEDYNDDVEDPKYYRGSALHQRLKDREIEEAADERDRQKEIEQIQAARRKLIEEGDPDAESIIVQMEQKMQEHLRKRLNVEGSTEPYTGVSDSDTEDGDNIDEQSSHKEPASSSAVEDEQQQEGMKPEELTRNSPALSTDPNENDKQAQSQFTTEFMPTPTDEASVSLSKDGSSTFLFAMSTAEPVVRKKAAAFADEEPEDKPKKHTPSWLPPSAFKSSTEPASDYQNGADSSALVASLSADEKKGMIKRLIDSIPTSKKDLFSFPIDWDMVDELDGELKYLENSSKTPNSFMRLLRNLWCTRLCDSVSCKNPYRYTPVDGVGFRKSCRALEWRFDLLTEIPFYVGLPLSLSLVYLDPTLALCASLPLLLLAFVFLYHMLENALVYARNEPSYSRMLYESPSSHGFTTWELVTLHPSGQSGPSVVGFLLLIDDTVVRANSPTVLVLHGNAGNAGHRLKFCQLLMKSVQCNVFIIDYRGFGRSTGIPSEGGLYADARSALEFLHDRSDLAADKLFLFGRSLGGAVAIHLVTNYPDLPVRGVMVENTFTSLPAVAQTIFGSSLSTAARFLLPTYFFINRYPSLDSLLVYNSHCRRKSLPSFLFLSGDADDIVPPKMMHELYQAYVSTQSEDCPPQIFSPSSFLRDGRHGLVIFSEGKHNCTWLCPNWPGVVCRFVQETLDGSVSYCQTTV